MTNDTKCIVTLNCLFAILMFPQTSLVADAPQATGVRFGIDQRVPWTTSRITGSPEPPAPYRLRRVFANLELERPVELITYPGSDRLVLMELGGRIITFRNQVDTAESELFFDLAASVPQFFRAYGIAFHPRFEQQRFCYLCYVAEKDLPDGTHVSRFEVTHDDPPRIDPASEQILLKWRSGGHNGGSLKFGPDGYLYISTGDASPPFPADKLNTGQDITDLLGSILRIDVDPSSDSISYVVPTDNPFCDDANARSEVWAYGFRNPWRMSFDAVDGDLWVGDVGWEMREMVYRVQRGGNYGWSLVEGSQPVHLERERGPTPIRPPLVEHGHDEARSVTGGFVYRGNDLPGLAGAYIYGDYVTGKIWGVRVEGQQVTWQQELADSSVDIICFGQDGNRELLVVGYDGTIHQLEPVASVESTRPFPTRLSETGLFASVADHKPAAGVIPYSVNAEPWADHATAQRLLALPGDTRLTIEDVQDLQRGRIRGAWRFPPDAVLAKTISLEMERGQPASRRRIETQLLHRHEDSWNAYTYLWNDEQTDAELAPAAGTTRVFTVSDPDAAEGKRRQRWRISSRTECLMCHTTRAGSILGFRPEQLDREHDYGDVVDQQLRTLTHINVLPNPDSVKPQPSPFDAQADLDARARSYLHVNCASCHRRGGGGTAAFDIQRQIALEKTGVLTGRPTQGTFGLFAPRVITPGDPYSSVLLYRMSKLGRGRMPHFGSQLIDQQGIRLIRNWILQLADEPPLETLTNIRSRQESLLGELRNVHLDPSEREKRLSELLATPSGAMQVMFAIDEQRLHRELAASAIQLATAGPPEVRDLFERYLPPDRRTQRLGDVVDSQRLLKHRGDAERGKQIFLESSTLQCRNCHQLGQQGKSLGPALDGIGKKYSRAELLQSIIEPSARIAPEFMTYVVETVDGNVFSGLLQQQTDAAVTLKNTQGVEIQVPRADIESLVRQRQSMMPEMLFKELTLQEAADLLEFLCSLR